MNVVAIDIGNTNIRIGCYIEDEEKFIDTIAGGDDKTLTESLKKAWNDMPISKLSKEKKKDGFLVASSVNPKWGEKLAGIISDELGEKLLFIGKEIPLPIETMVDDASKVGTDRLVCAAAAYAVAGGAVVVADFGTANTIDLVDEDGIFIGGVIIPGFDLCADALNRHTAVLPKVRIARPSKPYGSNTEEAISTGIYFSAIGTLEEVLRRYAEEIGRWPQTVITGGCSKIIKDDCPFVDSWVPNLAVKGVVLALKKYLEEIE